jgi:iron(III) transport system permease protein
MARPLVSPAPRSVALDPGRAVVPALLAVLAAVIGWPVAAVLIAGVVGPSAAPPPGVVLTTLAAALASTVGAVVAAALPAYAVARVDVPGRELAWRVFRVGVLVPPFAAPLALLVLAGPEAFVAGGSVSGVAAIVIGQTLAFLPHATALLVRALADVRVELEQAAEVLGAPRSTVVRRVTLPLAAPRLRTAAFAVLGLCLADVASPLLLGGDAVVLATFIVAAAAGGAEATTRAALMLAALAATAALAGLTWRHATVATRGWPGLPRIDRRASAPVRWSLGAGVWLAGLALTTLWAIIPLGSLLHAAHGTWTPSLEHWAPLMSWAGARPLRNSLTLGLGVALAGTTLALAIAWILERGLTPLKGGIEWLARVPVAVPGIAAGVGYLLTFGPPAPMLTGMLVLVAAVACWELPAVLRVARAGLARSDRTFEQAAISLGAGRVSTGRRIVVPALRPVAGWVFGYSFAGGVLAVSTVIVLAGSGPSLGTTTMLALAASGAPGAACAVATVLLAVAGGALLLGRTVAGRMRVPTLLA